MTAEFALTVPAVLACVALCVAVVIGAASYAGLAASAAAAARLVARGDDPGGAGIPEGAVVSIEPQGRTTCVGLTAGDGALSAVGLRISARACALDERGDE